MSKESENIQKQIREDERKLKKNMGLFMLYWGIPAILIGILLAIF